MAGIRIRSLIAAVLAIGVVGTGIAGATPGVVEENVRLVANVPGTTGGHAVIEGNRMYVGAYGLGMRAFDISNPYSPVEIGNYIPGPNQAESDPGARADAVPDAAVLDGRHIVSLGGTSRASSTQQTEFVDWTDPANPKLLWRFRGNADGEAHNGDIVDSRRLFLPSGTSAGNFRIFDLNPLLQTPPAAPKRLSANNPTNLWRDSPYRNGRPVGSGFTHIHDIEVYTDRDVLLPQDQWVDNNGDGTPDPTRGLRDIALVAEGGNYVNGNNAGSLFIIDITDPARPVALLRYQRPAGLGKPVRYVHEAQFLQGQPDVLITTDEDLHNGCDAGGATIHRVSDDLTEITELSQWFIGTGSPSPVCSTHVLSTKDNYAFIGSYHAGLQVVDLTDPAQPRSAGKYIAPGANSWGALVHPTVPGYLTYVGDFGPRGLDVFEFMANPTAKGTVTGNPAIAQVSGANEAFCENTGAPAAATVDALMVPLTAAAADGDGGIRAVGSGMVPRDINVYFYDKACKFMAGNSINSTEADALGPVPEGAGFAAVANIAPGPPTQVYATLIDSLPQE